MSSVEASVEPPISAPLDVAAITVVHSTYHKSGDDQSDSPAVTTTAITNTPSTAVAQSLPTTATASSVTMRAETSQVEEGEWEAEDDDEEEVIYSDDEEEIVYFDDDGDEEELDESEEVKEQDREEIIEFESEAPFDEEDEEDENDGGALSVLSTQTSRPRRQNPFIEDRDEEDDEKESLLPNSSTKDFDTLVRQLKNPQERLFAERFYTSTQSTLQRFKCPFPLKRTSMLLIQATNEAIAVRRVHCRQSALDLFEDHAFPLSVLALSRKIYRSALYYQKPIKKLLKQVSMATQNLVHGGSHIDGKSEEVFVPPPGYAAHDFQQMLDTQLRLTIKTMIQLSIDTAMEAITKGPMQQQVHYR